MFSVLVLELQELTLILTFNPKSKTSSRLILKISEFKFRGSEGLARCGRPSGILERSNIQRLLGQLEDLLSDAAERTDMRSASSSPIHSQAGDLSPRGSPSPNAGATQVGFGTQLTERGQGRVDKPAERTRKPVLPMADRLLGLLKKPSKQNTLPMQEAARPSNATTNNTRKPPILAPVSDERILGMTSKLEARANERHPHSSLSSQPFHLGHSSVSAIPYSKDLKASDDCEKENSQEHLNREKMLQSAPEPPMMEPSIEPGRRQVALPFVDQFQAPNPFEGLKRIPRRWVRVLEDQKAMLERNDSWFDARNHDRSSHASLPAKVQDDLSAFINRQPSSNLAAHPNEAADADDETSEYSPSRRIERSESGDEVKEASDEEDREIISLNDEQDIDEFVITDSGGHEAAFEHSHQSPVSEEEQDSDMEADVAATDMQFPSSARSVLGLGSKVANEAILHSKIVDEDQGSLVSSLKQSEVLTGLGVSISTEMDRVEIDDTQSPRDTAKKFESPKSPHGPNHESQRPQIFHQRITAAIPSSSPGDEEEDELELAVPHAVGDIIEESDTEMNEAPETSPELPSTALQNPKLIQVEQTPYASSRVPDGKLLRKKPQASRENKEATNISSDPVIPATFNDTSSQNVQSSSKMTCPNWRAGILTLEHESFPKQHVDGLQTQISMDHGEDDEEVALTQQLLLEYQSSQRKHIEPAHSSPVRHAILYGSTSSPGRNVDSKTSQDLSPGTHSPQPIVSPSSHTPIVQGGYSQKPLSIPSSPLEESLPKRASDAFSEAPENEPPRKRRRYIPAAAITDEEHPVRDTKEMARASRHTFNDLFSAVAIDKTRATSLVLDQVIPNTLAVSDPNALQASKRDSLFSPLDGPSAAQSVVEINEAPLSNVGGHITSTKEQPRSSSGKSGSSKTTQVLPSSLAPDDRLNGQVMSPAVDRIESDNEEQLNFFEEFRATYPDYAGSQNKFTWALIYIEWLEKGKQFLHRSLCDDFIRVNAADYLEYIRESRSSSGENMMTGWEYYHKNIARPVYRHEFITPDNLQDAISSLDPQQVEKTRKLFDEAKRNDSDGSNPISQSTRSTASVPSQELQPSLVPALAVSHDRGPNVDVLVRSPDLDTRAADIMHRTPFFETPSQIPAAKRKGLPLGGTVDGARSEGKTSARRLPWITNSSPKTANADPATPPHRILASTPAGHLDRSSVSVENARSRHSADRARQSPASPILGRTDDAPRRSFNAPSRVASKHTSLDGDPFKTPSLPPLMAASRSASRLSNSEIDEQEKVTEWLNSQSAEPDSPPIPRQVEGSSSKPIETPVPIASRREAQHYQDLSTPQHPSSSKADSRLVSTLSKCGAKEPETVSESNNAQNGREKSVRRISSFSEFIKARRKSGAVSSNASTPKSTPYSAVGKRFCTKPKA